MCLSAILLCAVMTLALLPLIGLLRPTRRPRTWPEPLPYCSHGELPPVTTCQFRPQLAALTYDD